MRNEIIRSLAASAIGVSSVFFSGCEVKPQATPTTATATNPGKGEILQTWDNSPSEVRLARLTELNYPGVVDFNPRKELTKAVAEIYCRLTKCKFTPQQLAASVSFLQPDQFKDKYRLDLEKTRINPVTEEDVKSGEANVFEFVEPDTQEVIFNQKLLDEYPDILKKREPRLTPALGKNDVGMVLQESILWHAYTHANTKKETIPIPPYVFGDLLTGMQVTLNKMTGFKFEGSYSNGKPTFNRSFEESVAEYTARILAKKAKRFYLSTNIKYSTSSQLLEAMVKKVGISEDEFLQIANGEIPVTYLITKLSTAKDPRNPNPTAAVRAMFLLGLYVSGESDLSDNDIRQILRDSVGI